VNIKGGQDMPKTVKWAKLINDIYMNKVPICPDCGGTVQGNIYSNDNKIGFAVFDCQSCKEHIKLSRIAIPEGFVAQRF
jgi:tRNA(Ile2) C34 agmatinyltransferase TiaS